MSRVLVTGSAGFIGSHICDHLKKNEHWVYGIDDLSGGFLENTISANNFTKMSICDVESIEQVFANADIDYVIHAAAYAAEGLSHFIRRYNYETNVVGSINLINAAVKYKIKGFVFLSSIATYGKQTPPFTEHGDLAPADPYGIAKMAVELDLKAACEMFGLPYIIFRPFNVYGERQNIGDAYRNVVGIFMNQCLQNKPMTIFGDGQQTRAFSYISDVAPAIAKSIDMPRCWCDTFNIGGTQPRTVWSLANLIGDVMGIHPGIQYLPARREAIHAHCNTDKSRTAFDKLGPEIHLEEGLRRMAEWVKEHGTRSTPKFTNIELTRNLPPSWAKL